MTDFHIQVEITVGVFHFRKMLIHTVVENLHHLDGTDNDIDTRTVNRNQFKSRRFRQATNKAQRVRNRNNSNWVEADNLIRWDNLMQVNVNSEIAGP